MRRQSGWTLMETVVALAIVAILAAIIYAVILYAVEVSRQGTCISNLRQIGIALKLYMEDYKQADWDTEIDSYTGIADQRERQSLVARWGFPRPDGLLALYRSGYVKSMELFECRSVHPRMAELSRVHYIYVDPVFLANFPNPSNIAKDNLLKLKQDKYNYKVVRDMNHKGITINLYLDGRVDRRPRRMVPIGPGVYSIE